MEKNIQAMQYDKEAFQTQKEKFKRGEISADAFKEAQNEIICKYGKIEQITQKAIWNILVLPIPSSIQKDMFGEPNIYSSEHKEGVKLDGNAILRSTETSGRKNLLYRKPQQGKENLPLQVDSYYRSQKTTEKKMEHGETIEINANCEDRKNFANYISFISTFNDDDKAKLIDFANEQPKLTVVKVPENQRLGIKVTQELVDILGGEVLPSYGKTKEELTLLEENDLLIKEQNDRGYFYRVGAFEAKQTYELGEEAFENLGFLQKFDYLKNQLQQHPLEKIQYDQETDSIKIKDKFSIKRDGDCIVKQIGDTSITNIDRHVILNKLKSIIEKKGEEEKLLHEERLQNTKKTEKELDDL